MKKNKIKEELQKRAIEKSLIKRGDSSEGFMLYVKNIYRARYKKEFRQMWWHKLMAKALMDIYMGLNDRLIIEMPPRMGKTELSVRMFSSYLQGLDDSIKIQYATYGATLSKVVAGETKEYMLNSFYKELFDTEFSQRLNTTEHWALTGGGGFQATSVEGAATGMGSEVFILDDLHKAGEADSKAKRDAVWSFYNASVLTRLEGRKAIVLIMQRLHEDDLVGRIKKQDGLAEDGGEWESLRLPIINDLDSFVKFFNWIERVNGVADVVSDDELEYIKQEANTRLKADIAIYKSEHKIIKKAHFEQFKNKRANVHFYEVAREIYLKTHSLKPSVVKYRDLEVKREPLITLDRFEYGLDFVVKLYKSISKREFKRQYMQDAEESEADFFKKEDFTYIADGDMPLRQNRYILVDNAESLEDAADDRGIVVVGKSIKEGIITTVVLDGAYGKWDVYGTSERIIHLMLKFPDAPVFIEGAGGGITLGVVLKQEIAKYNAKAQADSKPQIKNWVYVYKPDNKVSKNEIINLMANPLEIHTLKFYKFADGAFLKQLEKELLKYNPERKSNEDNVIDPLAKSFFLKECVPMLEEPKKKKKPLKRRGVGFKKNRSWRGV